MGRVITGNDWYDLNGQRQYPIDAAASCIDDAGITLPAAMLVDCRLRYPATLGRYAFLSALTSSPGIVTALFLTSDQPAISGAAASTFVPLAAVSLPRPVTANIQYPVRALAGGVAGWVVFGDGISETYTGRFSSPSQSQLMPRCALPYGPRPVRSVAREKAATALQGLVALKAGKDVEIGIEPRRVQLNGVTRTVQAVVFQLKSQVNRNVYAAYLGPCLARPESGNCPKTPLESINGVEPDCDGVLEIEFRGIKATPYAGGGGVLLEPSLSFADACPDDSLPGPNGELPIQADDRCCGGAGVVEPTSTTCSDVVYDAMEPVSDSVVFYDLFDPATGGVSFAVTELLDHCFTVRTGTAPETDYSCASGNQSLRFCADDGIKLGLYRPIAAYQHGGGCEHPSSLDKEVKVLLKPAPAGGIIFDYHLDAIDGLPRYFLACINVSTRLMQVKYFNGAILAEVARAPLTITTSTWCDLRLQIAAYPGIEPVVGKAAIAFTARAVVAAGDAPNTLSAVLESYGPGTGLFGIGSDNAACTFAIFALE